MDWIDRIARATHLGGASHGVRNLKYSTPQKNFKTVCGGQAVWTCYNHFNLTTALSGIYLMLIAL